MKVILITKSITKGGAASGARNLVGALCAAGAEVMLLDAYTSYRRRPIRLVRTAERIYERLVHDAETHCMRLGLPTFDLRSLYAEHHPDVIQLCDVSGNTVRFADIARVPCPVVHRMSDFWPYHGAHHYAQQSPTRPDLADRLLRRLIFDGSAMPDCRVAPSHWLAARLDCGSVDVIRNAVTIPENVVLRKAHRGPLRFGFISGHIMDPRKGFRALPPFLESLRPLNVDNIELHTFGHIPKDQVPRIKGCSVIANPPFQADELSDVYGKFDILLCPSRLDNSPNTVTEALVHGVPVIAQSGTGMDSYVRQDTGALVDFQNATQSNLLQFGEAAQRIVADFDVYSRSAYRFACTELSPTAIGAQYLSLFDRLRLGKKQ